MKLFAQNLITKTNIVKTAAAVPKYPICIANLVSFPCKTDFSFLLDGRATLALPLPLATVTPSPSSSVISVIRVIREISSNY